MATSKEIVVTLKKQIVIEKQKDTTSAQEKLPSFNGSNGGGGNNKKFYGGGLGANRSPATNLGEMIAHIYKPMSLIASAKSIARLMVSTATYSFDYYLRANDDYIGQQNVKIATSVIQRAGVDALTVIGSFATMGPVGFVVAAAKIGQYAFDIGKNYIEQQYQIDQRELELDYSRVRAGYSTMEGSIGRE